MEIPPNMLMQGQAPQGMAMQQPSPNMLTQQATPQQPSAPPPSQEDIQLHHNNLNDFQNTLKELIQRPDHDLSLSHLFGAASDLITKNKMSKGKQGSTAIEIAKQLSSPDFPREGPNGEKPSPQAIRKFLLNHFNQATQIQAALTSKFGPPQTQQPIGAVNAPR